MSELLTKMKLEATKRNMKIVADVFTDEEVRFKLKMGIQNGPDFLKFKDFIKNQITSDIGCIFKEAEGLYTLNSYVLEPDNKLAINTLENYGKIRAYTKISFLNMFGILLDNLNARQVQLPS